MREPGESTDHLGCNQISLSGIFCQLLANEKDTKHPKVTQPYLALESSST
jgi:hypothetical protein